MRSQTLKDYVLFPLLSGPPFPLVLAGNATANLTRNLWSFAIIFCGHFPEGTVEFDESETAEETRGEWYLRQMMGSANLTGGPLFHILSGNLSHQIEHHLFPDIPARRYAEIGREVKARSASATACRTTPDRSIASSARWSARSCGCRFPGSGSPSQASLREDQPVPLPASTNGTPTRDVALAG